MKRLDSWWEGTKATVQSSVALELVGDQEGLGDEVTLRYGRDLVWVCGKFIPWGVSRSRKEPWQGLCGDGAVGVL